MTYCMPRDFVSYKIVFQIDSSFTSAQWGNADSIHLFFVYTTNPSTQHKWKVACHPARAHPSFTCGRTICACEITDGFFFALTMAHTFAHASSKGFILVDVQTLWIGN